MAKTISSQRQDNSDLWKQWEEFGIVSGKQFAVDFRFYSANESIADGLLSGLTKSGIPTTKEMKRTLVVLKGWVIKATISKPWTLEALNEQCSKFCFAAEKLGITFEGCGAYMPPLIASASMK